MPRLNRASGLADLVTSERRNDTMSTSSSGSQQHQGVIRVTSEEARVVAVRLEGEFDLADAPGLRGHIERELERGNSLIVDLSLATFVDSTVIQVLVRGSQSATELERGFVLQLGAGSLVERALRITGIVPQLPHAFDRRGALELSQERTVGGRASSSRTVALHFPTGETEFWLTDQVFSRGDAIERDGRSWLVAEVTGDRQTGKQSRVSLHEARHERLGGDDPETRDRAAWNLPPARARAARPDSATEGASHAA
jgi:anti-anti-sigma factor